jgi:hypothetical protein
MSISRKARRPNICLYREQNVLMNTVQVVKEVIRLVWSLWPDDECHSRNKISRGVCGTHTLSFSEHGSSQLHCSSPPPPSNSFFPFISYPSSIFPTCYLPFISLYFSCYYLLAFIRAIYFLHLYVRLLFLFSLFYILFASFILFHFLYIDLFHIFILHVVYFLSSVTHLTLPPCCSPLPSYSFCSPNSPTGPARALPYTTSPFIYPTFSLMTYSLP